MVEIILLLNAAALVVFLNFKNKGSDRARHRRKRLQEKQEETLDILKKRKQP